MTSKTHWYVCTGSPSSGISTTLTFLESLGHEVFSEVARDMIDEGIQKGLTLDEIRKDEAAFQREALRRKIERESNLSSEKIYFFDRGIPDSIPYFQSCGLDPREALKFCKNGLYHKIFFLEPLAYVKDYARTEELETRNKLGINLKKIYLDLGYEVISVPFMTKEERARFILSNLD